MTETEHSQSDRPKQQLHEPDEEVARLERDKLELELQLKHEELASIKDRSWLNVMANPLILVIVTGFITLMTAITTEYLTSQRTLEAELIKKFAENPKTQAVRENLEFLIEVGLLPSYADRIESGMSD